MDARQYNHGIIGKRRKYITKWKNMKKMDRLIMKIAMSTSRYFHKNKIKILNVVGNKRITISKIGQNFKQNYKTIHDHVYSLNREGFILVNKIGQAQGRPVYIKITSKGRKFIQELKHPPTIEPPGEMLKSFHTQI